MTEHRTITALFHNRGQASEAVEELVNAGVSRSAIRVSPETDSTGAEAGTAYDVSKDEKDFGRR